jgi:phosphatidylserine decarboxylase
MQNFIDALKLATFPIHKEGYFFIIIFAVISLAISLLSSELGLIGLVLTLWCIFFFRDPNRVIPDEKNAIVSPADGVITLIENDVSAPSDLGLDDKKFNKISIFLNVFNVHVNRVPISGKIVKVSYQAGKFLSANVAEASSENERNSVIVKTETDQEIIFTQVAGLVARRIISEAVVGQEVKTGDRYGIIRFGSRLDVYLPKEIEIKAKIGQTMIGGESIIAKI